MRVRVNQLSDRRATAALLVVTLVATGCATPDVQPPPVRDFPFCYHDWGGTTGTPTREALEEEVRNRILAEHPLMAAAERETRFGEVLRERVERERVFFESQKDRHKRNVFRNFREGLGAFGSLASVSFVGSPECVEVANLRSKSVDMNYHCMQDLIVTTNRYVPDFTYTSPLPEAQRAMVRKGIQAALGERYPYAALSSGTYSTNMYCGGKIAAFYRDAEHRYTVTPIPFQ